MGPHIAMPLSMHLCKCCRSSPPSTQTEKKASEPAIVPIPAINGQLNIPRIVVSSPSFVLSNNSPVASSYPDEERTIAYTKSSSTPFDSDSLNGISLITARQRQPDNENYHKSMEEIIREIRDEAGIVGTPRQKEVIIELESEQCLKGTSISLTTLPEVLLLPSPLSPSSQLSNGSVALNMTTCSTKVANYETKRNLIRQSLIGRVSTLPHTVSVIVLAIYVWCATTILTLFEALIGNERGDNRKSLH